MPIAALPKADAVPARLTESPEHMGEEDLKTFQETKRVLTRASSCPNFKQLAPLALRPYQPAPVQVHIGLAARMEQQEAARQAHALPHTDMHTTAGRQTAMPLRGIAAKVASSVASYKPTPPDAALTQPGPIDHQLRQLQIRHWELTNKNVELNNQIAQTHIDQQKKFAEQQESFTKRTAQDALGTTNSGHYKKRITQANYSWTTQGRRLRLRDDATQPNTA